MGSKQRGTVIFLWILIVILALCVLAAYISLKPKRDESPAEPGINNPLPVTSSSTAAVGNETRSGVTPANVSISSTSPPNASENWNALHLNCGGFGISYPPNWPTVKNINDPYPTPYDLATIIYPRSEGSYDQEMVDINIVCYKRDQTIDLQKWVLGFYASDVTRTPEGTATSTFDATSGEAGGIEAAIDRANSGERGALSYDSIVQDGVSTIEVGHVSIYGTLTYDAFLAGSAPFVYLLRLNLALVSSSTPTDQYYVNVFRNMLSTVSF